MRMDAAQFERVVSEQQRMVFSIAIHSLRDRALAEEITQDVFLALYQHHDRIESAAHLVHWLRRVTTRRCIDQIRRQRWRRWLRLSETGEAESASASEQRGDPMLSARLQRLIHALPAAARMALVLRYQEDLDAAEIGRLLGLSEKAVHKLLRRAVAQLKLRLKPPPASEPRGAKRKSEAKDAAKPKRGVRACVAMSPEPAEGNLEQR